jgi:predicted amidophosphoribosyltransferase
VEKVQDVQDRAGETRNVFVTQEMKEEVEKRAKSVNESEESEGKSVNADERKKKEHEQQQKEERERRKEIAKRLARDTGHNIDLEA